MSEITNTALKSLVTDEVSALGYSLWGMEIVPKRFSCLLRVYIDAAEGKARVDINDCARVSRRLGLCLDRKRYVLEVSSPGLARKFFEPGQYSEYIGKRIQIRIKTPINGKRNFNGQLIACDETGLCLTNTDGSGEKCSFTYMQIEKSRLEPDYETLFKKSNYSL